MTFSIGFCFFPEETSQDFIWAFQCFQELGINPSVMVMDGDQAQKNAAEVIFPNTPSILCIWHVKKCVLSNCKSIVRPEDWPEFEAAWPGVIQVDTNEQFNDRWLDFQSKYSRPSTQ